MNFSLCAIPRAFGLRGGTLDVLGIGRRMGASRRLSNLQGLKAGAGVGGRRLLRLRPDRANEKRTARLVASLLMGVALAVPLFLGSGCVAPIGADKVSTRQAYAEVEANALRTRRPSATTVFVLHRHGLSEVAQRQPEVAVEQLHQKALDSEDRSLLFALSELSYVAAEKIRRSVKPWDPRDARDYYLGSAVYAWLFLFADGKPSVPGPFDRRFRVACDFYNYSLGLALADSRKDGGGVELRNGRRRLPVGEIQLQLNAASFPAPLKEFESILLADQFRLRGLSVRNREPGIGTPLICVRSLHPQFGIRPATPATVLLRGPASLEELASGSKVLSLELYSSLDEATVAIGEKQVPLETDLTAYRAYTLTQSRVWKLGRLDFLAPAERFPSQLILNQPYQSSRIPLVLVHGTFSSPVTWAEMANSLTADPTLRQRYQVWNFIYGSGNPLVQSVADLRSALTAKVKQLDPQGTNAWLRRMVIIGHSQGGLLTKGTAIDAGDRLWRVFCTNSLEQLGVSEERRDELRRYLFLEPLPFVKRVVFIATPHRGSYLAGGFARRLARRLVSLPSDLVSNSKETLRFAEGSEAGYFLRGNLPTSLDGMSPKNPGLLAMAEIPISPGIKAHSIIPVLDKNDYRQGRDGLVTYASAHMDGVESEFIVLSKHSCLNHPSTIEEVRRILHEHLGDPPPEATFRAEDARTSY